MSESVSLSIGQHSVAGRKDANEDSYGVLIPDAPLLGTKGVAMVIADGMSGSDAGKDASESCVKSFLTDYYSTSETWTVKTSASQILSALNRWLYGQGQSRFKSNRGMVSTISALVLKSATVHIFHVGDSRITRLRNGSLEPLTQDHRIYVSAGKTFLSRAMGIDLNVDVDYRSLAVELGDVFIFTTDGVHEFLSDGDMTRLLAEYESDLDACARAIVELAHANASPDNLTCQIVRVNALGDEDENDYCRKLQERPFPPALSEGMIMDGYRILREMHASKRTQVYLAVDEESGERVVLKTPSVNYEDDPGYLQLFTREEWAGKRIDSPHVLKVVEPKRPRQFLYYVVEYVEGQTLRQWMHDNPEPDLNEMREIIGQIALGLRAFHRKEMIHQDLKPENIVIDKYGTVKIIDFGSVKIAGLEEIAVPVKGPSMLGTVDYSAPEYILGHALSNRADIYSLGIIAYEMLTGKHPYGKGFSAKRHVGKCPYTPAARHNPGIPAWIDGALEKAVYCDQAKRYEVLSEFLGDLSRPNPKFVGGKSKPLIESDPVAFWRGLAFVLAAVVFILLVKIAG